MNTLPEEHIMMMVVMIVLKQEMHKNKKTEPTNIAVRSLVASTTTVAAELREVIVTRATV